MKELDVPVVAVSVTLITSMDHGKIYIRIYGECEFVKKRGFEEMKKVNKFFLRKKKKSRRIK